eukprot:gene75-4324_t
MSYEQELQTSVDIAYEAGKIGLQYCIDREKKKTELQIETKSDKSEVTIADKELNELITTKLKNTFPNYRIIGEESVNSITEDLGKGFVFYVDPIDGTKEFISNNGEWSVMIGLAKDGIPVMGVVYQPTLDLLYFASEGSGAFKIEKKGSKPISMKCRETENFDDCIVVQSRSHSLPAEKQFVDDVGIKPKNIYQHGSFGLKCCQIADGKADLYINFSGKTSYWDSAPGCIILKEAGGSGVHTLTGKLVLNGFSVKNQQVIFGTTKSLLQKVTKSLLKAKY